MGMMVEGEWKQRDWATDEEGRFQRSTTTFRDWIRADGSGDFPVEGDRYHLYVSYACPWAHRTLMTRTLKGLEEVVTVSVVDPYMGEEGWHFSESEGAVPDFVNDKDYLREVYKLADDKFTGRVTVPVLWDKRESTVVNNESIEIVRMFDTEFDELAERPEVDLYPEEQRDEIDRVIDAIYQPINNGVYRSGFAHSQKAYEEAVGELFDALDHWESVLGDQRYLVGEQLTEADICMFTTLYRFDQVYHTHFKCNVRRIDDYPNLWAYAREIYQLPGIAETCNMSHIKEHYYTSHESVNPRRIIARGPDQDWEAPHGRDELPKTPLASN